MIGRLVHLAKLAPAWAVLTLLILASLLGVTAHLVGLPHVRVAQGVLLVSVLGAGWLVRTASAAGRSLTRVVGRTALLTAVVLMLVNLGWALRYRTLESGLKKLGLPATLADLPAAPAGSVFAEHDMDALVASLTTTGKDAIPTSTAAGNLNLEIHGNAMLTGTPPEKRLHRWPVDAAKKIDAFMAQHPVFFRELDGRYGRIIDRSTRYADRDPKLMAAHPRSVEIPRYAELVNLARCYRLYADRQAMRGDRAGADRSLGRMIKLTALASSDPFLIAKMIAVANGGIAASSPVRNLQNGGPPPSAANLRALCALPMGRAVAQGFATEGASMLDQRRLLNRSWIGGIDGISRGDFVVAKLSGLVGLNDAAFLEHYRLAVIPIATATGWPAEVSPRLNEAYYESRGWAPIAWLGGGINFVQLYQKGLECDTRLRLAAVVAAIHARKAKTGTWPAALKDIVAQLPVPDAQMDPFSGKPFSYEPSPKGAGYVLASVGPWGDGRDSKDQRLEVRTPLPAATIARPAPAAKKPVTKKKR